MSKKEIRQHASSIWRLLVDNTTWSLSELKRRSGLTDYQFGAALGWLAHENKIVFNQEIEGVHASMSVNVFIG